MSFDFLFQNPILDLSIFYYGFIAYIGTALIVEATILSVLRNWLRSFKFLYCKDKFVFDCRMCAGFWVCLAMCFTFKLDIISFLSVYGLSYWMATLEQGDS